MSRVAGWRPPYDFAAARPTFIDAWPPAWHELAPSSEIVLLDRVESNALGAQIAGCQHWFAPAPARLLLDLARRLDGAIARQGRSCFVRLTSRSPKDSLLAQRKGMRVSDGAQALALFVEGSERCAADLRMGLDSDDDLAIVVKSWIDFPPWAEFRCFMVDRSWVGASQAQHLGGAAFPEIASRTQAILAALTVSMQQIVAASPIGDAAFDLVFPTFGEGFPGAASAILLDVNPLLEVTDHALFAPAADFDRTFRFRCPEDQVFNKIPLPTQGTDLPRE